MTTRLTDDTITIARLTSFSDGVFAIAVTLLVFNLKVPHIPAANVHRLLPGVIKDMIPMFLTYLVTFLIIGIYWTFHHRMLNIVNRADGPFLWMNIWYLLAISFIPFPTALVGAYFREVTSFIFYIGSVTVVGALSAIMLAYASGKRRLIKDSIGAPVVKYLFLRQFTSIVIFLLAIPIAFFQLRVAQYFLFTIFPVHWFTRSYFRKYSEGLEKK
jgi:uncharacterized membrane protein